MDTKITPLPWEAFTEERFSGWYAIREKDGGEVGSGDGGFTKEDAAFIVKAVNTHDRLMMFCATLAQLVYTQNGNQHADINALLDDVKTTIAEGK